ncbi:hypothetical protein ACQKIE_19175, partial [Luteibacter sp. NPDC031894]|uniref:hypothetical protein n=1 Tax=Luteibacter sp. NPDC031894 TaxID=3390572 RepID=UPI003D015514
MSTEKVVRYGPVVIRRMAVMEAREGGMWVEYPDVAGLVEVLKAVLPFCVTDVLEHCDGNKCRE